MAYFLFVDESGGKKDKSPYEVLAGVCVEDTKVWNLIKDINDAEEKILGIRYSRAKEEIKARKFLKRKVFRQAKQMAPFDPELRKRLARECVVSGDTSSRDQIVALAQAKLELVSEIFKLCSHHGCRCFASIIQPFAPEPVARVLRKDYSYLFERFFYFLEDKGQNIQGVVVFDELEKSKANILIGQMEEYFLNTQRGRERSRQVIPEPFFVHSDLTSLIQVADLVAYVVSWGYRGSRKLVEDAREEIRPFSHQVSQLGYTARRDLPGNPGFRVPRFAVIDDLRSVRDQLESR